MPADNKTPQTFEQALKMIEKIVAEVEEGKIGLDESVEKYESCMKLLRFCQEKLNQAEKRIEIIEKTALAEPSANKNDTNKSENDTETV